MMRLTLSSLALLLVCASCSSASSGGSGAKCFTLRVTPSVYDPTGGNECEFLITTSGSADCATMYGVAANTTGSCPSAGLVGCCVTDIGAEGAAPGTTSGLCYYDAALATEAKASCTTKNNTWQTAAP